MNIIGFLVSIIIFIGGFFIMGNAFYVPGFEALVFFLGIVTSVIGIAIPVHLLKRIDG
ncbi:MAG: hypothetical protein ACKVOG_11850 [Rhodoglobus sp.]